MSVNEGVRLKKRLRFAPAPPMSSEARHGPLPLTGRGWPRFFQPHPLIYLRQSKKEKCKHVIPDLIRNLYTKIYETIFGTVKAYKGEGNDEGGPDGNGDAERFRVPDEV